MRVLMIADGRSPHTAGWVRGMVRLGITASLLSSHLMDEEQRGSLEAILGPSAVYQPAGVWSRARPRLTSLSPNRGPRRTTPPRDIETTAHRTRPGAAVRLLAEIELRASARLTARLEHLVDIVRPDALHAFRVQFEGIAVARSRARLPVALSTWGQDLVHTARSIDRMARPTTRALQRTDLLMSDCERDAELATEWGLRPGTPRYVIPGNFGVDLTGFPDRDPELPGRWGVEDRPLVVYPRGISGCADYQGFVAAVRCLVAEGVDASFVGVGLAPRFGRDGGVPGRLRCTDRLDQATMFSLAAASTVTVSPTFWDGMPNSVLEGMAGGAIPVCGELSSLRELERRGAVIAWCQPGDPASIASAIRSALRSAQDLQNRARNRDVVARDYSTSVAVARARDAYERLLRSG